MAFENKTYSSEDTLYAADMNNIMEGIVEAKTAAVGEVSATIAENTNTLTVEIKDQNGNILATTEVTLPSGGAVDSSKFVPTTTSLKKLYGTDGQGNQVIIPYTYNLVSSADIVQRNPLGAINIGEFDGDSHAVSNLRMKNYVSEVVGDIENALAKILEA